VENQLKKRTAYRCD